MESVYIALEAIAALTLGILLYANIFELKQSTKKRRVFSILVILNLVAVVSDLITWIDLGWANAIVPFWIATALAYIFPCFSIAVFVRYMYVHITEKTKINKIPFIIIYTFCGLVGLATIVFCFTGNLFDVTGGVFTSGPLETLYFVLYALCPIFCLVVVGMNAKRIGMHDLISCLLFLLLPLIAILLSVFDVFKIDLSVPFLGVDMLVIFVLLQRESEKKLLKDSNNDELTGLYNRRAYEDDMLQYPDVPPEDDFIYACIDINGLKIANDNLGHLAGDELIKGAAYCLKLTLGNHGKVYRVGGDEFVVMFFADKNKFEFLKEDLDNAMLNWKGNLVSEVSMSIGYASKREFPESTVKDMSLVAEKRMYAAKEKYYSNKGIDRRGQSEAYKVLCSVYTKILKINITEDSFSIINMDVSEQTAEKGFSQTISKWLKDFGLSGNVYSEDLDSYLEKTDIEYMRNYFKANKTSLSIFYRRKYEDVFKQVCMDILPANDYSDDDQNLFLYVKDIDK